LDNPLAYVSAHYLGLTLLLKEWVQTKLCHTFKQEHHQGKHVMTERVIDKKKKLLKQNK